MSTSAKGVTSKFLSKEEREKVALARLQAKRAEQEAKKTQAKEAHARFLASSSKSSYIDPLYSSSSSSSSRKADLRGGSGPGREVDELESAPKKKQRSERGGEVFRENWDASEDTSRNETDPLYADPMQLKVLFGRGKMAGLDEHFGKVTRNKSGARDKQAGNTSETRELHWSDKGLEDMNERDWRIFREDFDIRVQAHGGLKNMTHPLRTWEEGNFPEHVMKAIQAVGFKNPSPIQRQAIPVLHKARSDIIGIAETGSGKTAAFLVPLLCLLATTSESSLDQCSAEGPLGIAIAPTRELAMQIEQDCKTLMRYSDLRSACVVGGESIDAQISLLRTSSIHVIVGTPGRLADLVDNSYMVLNQCVYVVLDEADRMVDMGFEQALTSILDALPPSNDNGGGNRIMAMFSATMPPEVERIAKTYLRRPVVIKVGDMVSSKNTRIKQTVRYITEAQKKSSAIDVLRNMGRDGKCIVFVNAKKQADLVGNALEGSGFRLAVLHGGKSQDQRNDALQAFRDNAIRVLVATDVAGRGLDISDITTVLNYDCPAKLEAYTHRIGRTGRAGRSGEAITLVTDADSGLFPELKNYILSCDPKAPLPHQINKKGESSAPLAMV